MSNKQPIDLTPENALRWLLLSVPSEKQHYARQVHDIVAGALNVQPADNSQEIQMLRDKNADLELRMLELQEKLLAVPVPTPVVSKPRKNAKTEE